ncbi:hypothetical protein ACLB2K_041269 [Fragaria x ananassa]
MSNTGPKPKRLKKITGWFQRTNVSSSSSNSISNPSISSPNIDHPPQPVEPPNRVNALERDPGLRSAIWKYPVNERDSVRKAYILLGPFQPELVFPLSEHGDQQLRLWPNHHSFEEIETCRATCWIQAHGIPPELMTKNNGRKLGEMLGSVLEVEDPKEGQPLSPIHTSRQASTLVADFLAANAPVGSIGAKTRPMQWILPPVGTFKVNVDASWHPPDRTDIRVVIRDSDRRLIAGISFSCRNGSVIEAKATASLARIELAASLQLMEIIMETDAKEVVEEILSNQRKIPREANAVAHAAAMLGKGLVDPLRWATQPPPNLSLVLRNDGLPYPHS